MKTTRKSTAVLLTVWVATFVLYLFVKPETPDAKGYPAIMNTMLSSVLPDGENTQQR
ncbi:hypothetical protein JK358_10540 [Nocardia sp. 2]|uniref:Uncharacterized protein n=1 Tax=Nocardia acididurans TaxID=2802282 RepID=A0ABS1M4X0_9NOCA|nr:hypothetical protein [Nocardia acididurans]MBL1074829.1 hypothetical protein [Nocardia acididurans]